MHDRTSARAMFCVTFLFWFSQYAYTPYLNPELQAMGAAATFMGLVSGSYRLAQLLTRIPIGIAADRAGLAAAFWVMGGVGLLALTLTLLLLPRRSKETLTGKEL